MTIVQTTIESPDSTILEVKTCWSEDEANELLTSGNWLLCHAGLAHKDLMGYQAKPCFIVGRIR